MVNQDKGNGTCTVRAYTSNRESADVIVLFSLERLSLMSAMQPFVYTLFHAQIKS